MAASKPRGTSVKDISIRSVGQAYTPEGEESRCIALAYRRAEQQLVDGTASSQVITHFLKLGTVQHQLELERLRKDNLLTEAKIHNLEAAENNNKKLDKAIKAFGIYSGNPDGEEEDDDDDEESEYEYQNI